MHRCVAICSFVVLLAFVVPVHSEEKAIKQEDLLRLKNVELNIQNLELRAELLTRELEKLRRDRDIYIDELYKSYGLGGDWKIDLQKGVWFAEPKEESAKKPQ